jgi:DsbC/DsbD-like thiol-disulfide interchange protein
MPSQRFVFCPLFAVLSAVFLLSLSMANADETRYVKLSSAISPSAVAPGGSAVLQVTLKVSPKVHIYAVDPGQPSLIPTKFTPSTAKGITFGAPVYPAAQPYSEAGVKANVYRGTVVIKVPVKVARSAAPGVESVNGSVYLQGCTDFACYPPQTLAVHQQLTVK